jgi:hypothetical protein
MSATDNNISANDPADNITEDTSDIPSEATTAASDPTPIRTTPKTEFEFNELLQKGKEFAGVNVEYKLEFDTQIIDGSKVIGRLTTGEFLFSARTRFRNYAVVTNDKTTLVVPVYFTDIETNEKLEIHVGNNSKDTNKETPN